VQFHEIAFAVPLLALSLTSMLRGRFAATVSWSAPLVLVKDDLGLTVAVLGVFIALRQRSHRLEGAGLVCWGAGWFLVSTFLILPLLNAGGQYDYTYNLGSPLEIFWPPVKWLTLGMLLLAAGVIGARSPVVWMMVPSRAVRVTAVAASAVVTLVLGSSMPLADLVRPQRWELTWRAQPAQEALEAVPDGSVLAVDITLLAPAVPDHEVQWLQGPNQRGPD